MTIETLRACYRGFFIDQPVSNNAFSFDQRQNKRIYVAPLIEGALEDVETGEENAFCEMYEGNEIARKGLRHFVYWKAHGKHFFIFDNHNHAFVFWVWAMGQGLFEPGAKLIHVDQHKDTRWPSEGFAGDPKAPEGLKAAFQYANTVLNVGNFIVPALERGFFSEVIHCDHLKAFESVPEPQKVLDIDMDVFSEDMGYIPQALKIDFIQAQIRSADLITIATSPYFIEERKSATILHQILKPDQRWSSRNEA